MIPREQIKKRTEAPGNSALEHRRRQKEPQEGVQQALWGPRRTVSKERTKTQQKMELMCLTMWKRASRGVHHFVAAYGTVAISTKKNIQEQGREKKAR